MGRFPSGQRGQTVNLLAQPSKVQILLSPLYSLYFEVIDFTVIGFVILIKNIVKPFYIDGLCFECHRCSTCCRHTPGYVFLSLNDLNLLVTATGLNEKDFLKAYCRTITTIRGKKISLKEKENYDCIFWEKDGCLHYKARPFQCRSFPFWRSFLGSKKRWQNLTSFCPGVGKGKLHLKEKIEEWIEQVQNENYFYV